ncbi:SCO2523 family variant P-loop protein [Longispora sp. NPDC051575]|uniref:SCO2523 family variant P-loop protein n=1 Tax=Longispora sp. NPDC051575 TaxID=3154943 RepID=UPI00343A8E5C
MLVFSTSDKGGTGRSVTSSNVAYRRALDGGDVCYLDFDFGSPTAGAIFNITSAVRGAPADTGLHSYLQGRTSSPVRSDVWSESNHESSRSRPAGAGQLVLFPGDQGGGEFSATKDAITRCVRLFRRLEEEFELCFVDLSAGRSYATEIVLAATAAPELRSTVFRWLVFHRWTRQHIIAAGGLVNGPRGIIAAGVDRGHDRDRLVDSIRYVRTAVVDPESESLASLRAGQVTWLKTCNEQLKQLASREGVGAAVTLGQVPLDPVLQWREQLLTDSDLYKYQIANRETVDAFQGLAKRLFDDDVWSAR